MIYWLIALFIKMKSILSSARICLLALLAVASAVKVNHEGQIKRCTRSLALLEPDVVIYTNDISFIPEKDYESGSRTVF